MPSVGRLLYEEYKEVGLERIDPILVGAIVVAVALLTLLLAEIQLDWKSLKVTIRGYFYRSRK